MFYNLDNYILLQEYCSVNNINTMRILRNKKIITIKIGKYRYILKSTIPNFNYNLYTNLRFLYPIGEFFINCGVSKSFKQTLERKDIFVDTISLFGVKFIKLNKQFYTNIDNGLCPVIVNRYFKKDEGNKHINISGIDIVFI